MTLGHAAGDARSTNYPVLWAFGGKEFEADGKTVAINSPETLKACEWYVETFKVMDPGVDRLARSGQQPGVPGRQGLGDGQRQHDLPGRSHRRERPAKPDAAKKELIETMDHANWPAGPAGRFGQYNINLWGLFASSKNARAARRSCAPGIDPEFLDKWTKAGQSYFIPPLKGIENADVWPDDPKLKIFRELNKVNRLPGTPGPADPLGRRRRSTSSSWSTCSPRPRPAR